MPDEEEKPTLDYGTPDATAHQRGVGLMVGTLIGIALAVPVVVLVVWAVKRILKDLFI